MNNGPITNSRHRSAREHKFTHFRSIGCARHLAEVTSQRGDLVGAVILATWTSITMTVKRRHENEKYCLNKALEDDKRKWRSGPASSLRDPQDRFDLTR